MMPQMMAQKMMQNRGMPAGGLPAYSPMMIGDMPESARVTPTATAAQQTGAQVAAPITATTAPVGLPVAQSTGAIPYGLAGSEQALLGGTAGALSAIGYGTNRAVGGLQSFINSLESSSSSDQQSQPIDMSFLSSGAPTAAGFDMSSIAKNIDASRGAINQAFGAADSALSGYNQGQGALKMQADLSGANGKQAQAAAYAAYQSSPAMQYQMDQMQKATERSAAARGGLMSGGVLQELQRNASGIASQDYQNQFANLGTVAQAGLGAASQIAQNKQQQAATEAGLAGTLAGIEGNLAAQQMAGQNALANTNLSGRFNLESQRLQNEAARKNQILGIKSGIASQIADLYSSAGLNVGGLYTQTGQQLSQGRTQAGQAIAQNATQAASNMAQYLNQQGIGVSDMMSKDISSITDFMYQPGMQDKADMQNLADLIARINGAQGATVMQGNQDLAAAKAAGTLGVGNAINNAATQGIATGLIGGK